MCYFFLKSSILVLTPSADSPQYTHLRRFAFDSTSKFHVESSPRFHRFWKAIQVEIITSIQRGNFDVDSTLKIDEISLRSPRGFFCVVLKRNRQNCCTRCFRSFIFYHFLLWKPILSLSDRIWLCWLNLISTILT